VLPTFTIVGNGEEEYEKVGANNVVRGLPWA